MGDSEEKRIKLSVVAEKMKLTNLTPDINLSKKYLTAPEVNRPALQLTGFFDGFDNERMQVIGQVERAYYKRLSKEDRISRFKSIIEHRVPGIVFCRDIRPDEGIIEFASEMGVPLMQTAGSTSAFIAEIIRWLKVQLAPSITVHGVLVDVHGEGVLITGESGIGKSEAALELIVRGHRLVTDDAVIIKKVSDETLVGKSPELTKHLIELRGIGIIDVKEIFGVESVKDTQQIDMEVHLEEWDEKKTYERMGLNREYNEYLGNKIVTYNLPVRPGRNIAVIVETAAVNHRQEQMGYNTAQRLYEKITKQQLERDLEEDEDEDVVDNFVDNWEKLD